MTMLKKIIFWTSPQHVFVTLGLLFGLLFVFLIPPFQAPDEYQHFYRAFQLSEGRFISESQEGDCYGYSNYFPHRPCAGGQLPKSLLTTVRNVSSEDLRFRPERKQKLEDLFSVLNLPLHPDDRVFIKFPTIVLYSPLPYLPQTLGVCIGKLINTSPLLMMYLGRILNLLFWMFLGAKIIKLTPILKWLFVLLLLMPMSLFQAASLSADAVTISLSFIWISFCLNCSLVKSSLKITDLAILVAIAMAIALCKQAYLPLLLLFGLIPVSKLENKKKYVTVFCALLILSFVFSLIWYTLASQVYVPLFDNVSLVEQLKFLSQHPFHLILVIGNSLFEFGSSYLEEFVGKLGWLDTRLPVPVIISYLVMLAIVALYSPDRDQKLSPKQKLMSSILGILNFCFIVTLFYLTLTPVGGNKVIFIQGRYLIPIAPLFFLPLSNLKFNWSGSWVGLGIVSYLFAVEICTLSTLLNRYYF